MNTESLLAEDLTSLERMLKEVVGLSERCVAQFRQMMFCKRLSKKKFLITEGKTCNFIGIVVFRNDAFIYKLENPRILPPVAALI